MNSDYIHLDTDFVNLDVSKDLQDGTMYRLQNTASGRSTHLNEDADVYIVISDVEPTDRAAAMKSAIILSPGGAPYEYRAAGGRNAWAFGPFGDTSLSINAVPEA